MQPPTMAFTTKYSARTRVLFSEIQIAEHFNPPPVPKSLKPKKFRAIWDTGATGTAITQKVIDEVGLKPTGMAKVNTASEEGMLTEVYHISVFLPNKVCIPQLKVTRTKIVDSDVLLGMDIISQGDFAITYLDGKTVLSFRLPSTTCLDFVEEINRNKKLLAPRALRRVGRNAPCPCGSGKKYKNCHGKGTT